MATLLLAMHWYTPVYSGVIELMVNILVVVEETLSVAMSYDACGGNGMFDSNITSGAGIPLAVQVMDNVSLAVTVYSSMSIDTLGATVKQ